MSLTRLITEQQRYAKRMLSTPGLSDYQYAYYTGSLDNTLELLATIQLLSV